MVTMEVTVKVIVTLTMILMMKRKKYNNVRVMTFATLGSKIPLLKLLRAPFV